MKKNSTTTYQHKKCIVKGNSERWKFKYFPFHILLGCSIFQAKTLIVKIYFVALCFTQDGTSALYAVCTNGLLRNTCLR